MSKRISLTLGAMTYIDILSKADNNRSASDIIEKLAKEKVSRISKGYIGKLKEEQRLCPYAETCKNIEERVSKIERIIKESKDGIK